MVEEKALRNNIPRKGDLIDAYTETDKNLIAFRNAKERTNHTYK
jgi:hypothetical protein